MQNGCCAAIQHVHIQRNQQSDSNGPLNSKLLRVLVVASVVFLFSADRANAQEMRPLSSILQAEQSPSMYVYAFERRAGLLSTLYARFSNYDSEQHKQLASILLMKSASANMGALFMAERAGLNLTMDKTTEKALAFGRRYNSIMNQSWQTTGHAISPFIEADQDVCLQPVEAFDKALDQ